MQNAAIVFEADYDIRRRFGRELTPVRIKFPRAAKVGPDLGADCAR